MQFKNIFVLDVIYGYVQLIQARGVTVVLSFCFARVIIPDQ
jgi:hypothetical protein